MRWAFWRSPRPEPRRALPDDVGLPTTPRPPAAAGDVGEPDPDDRPPPRPAPRTSGARPADHLAVAPEPPLTTPAPELDRTALAAAGAALARIVAGAPEQPGATDERTLAAAATAALAARLPALAGVRTGDPAEPAVEPGDGPAVEPGDGPAAEPGAEPAAELLHAYADLLVSRTQRRTSADRHELLAVAHTAAAAVGAADDPALLLLAGVPAGVQLRAAAALLAQTADDGGGAPRELAAEVRALFQR